MNQFKVNYDYEIILTLLKKQSHGRELANTLRTSLTRVQTALSDLRKTSIVDYETRGRNHMYFIKKNLISKAHVLNAEQYKLTKLLSKYSFLEPLCREITILYPRLMILLFGSYAKFIPKENSDIDLYVYTSSRKIKEGIQRLHHRLSVHIGDFNKDDLLMQEIMNDHVIIQGGEQYYEKLRLFT